MEELERHEQALEEAGAGGGDLGGRVAADHLAEILAGLLAELGPDVEVVVVHAVDGLGADEEGGLLNEVLADRSGVERGLVGAASTADSHAVAGALLCRIGLHVRGDVVGTEDDLADTGRLLVGLGRVGLLRLGSGELRHGGKAREVHDRIEFMYEVAGTMQSETGLLPVAGLGSTRLELQQLVLHAERGVLVVAVAPECDLCLPGELGVNAARGHELGDGCNCCARHDSDWG